MSGLSPGLPEESALEKGLGGVSLIILVSFSFPTVYKDIIRLGAI